MKILDRYIVRGLIPPFFGGLFVILFVLVIDFILDILNLIIAKGVPAMIVGKLFVYNLAWMISLAVPMAALVSSLMAFGRLSGDREIVAARSLGIPFWRMMLPALFVMMLLSVVMILFGDRVVPETNLRAKTLMVQIRRKKPLTALRPRIFIDDFPNIVLYIERINDKTGKIFGVKMYEKQQSQRPRVIIAPEGEVKYVPQEDAVKFTLYNGEIHEIDPDNPERYTRIEFSRQVINITELGTKLGEQKLKRRGDRELSISMLADRIEEYERKTDSLRVILSGIVNSAIDSLFVPKSVTSRGRIHSTVERRALLRQRKIYSKLRKYQTKISESIRRKRKLEVERQKKYSLPLACLVFLLVGAPVGAWARRGGIGVAAGISFGFFLIYWAFLIGGEELADRAIVSPVVGMWSGNVVMAVVGLIMLYRVTYQSRFSGFGWIAKIFSRKERKSYA